MTSFPRSILLPFVLAFGLVLGLLVTVQRAVGEDVAPGVPDAGLAIGPGDVADPGPPVPADPVAAPGDALDGLRLWWKTGWAYAILFAVAGVTIALSARVKRLQTGWAAVVAGTLVAAITVLLTAKAAGLSDAQAIAAGLHVVMAGGLWLLKKNAATVDLSTATPADIAAALQAANKPPAFPPEATP